MHFVAFDRRDGSATDEACAIDGIATGRLAGKRILIVEDQVLLAMDLQLAFEDEGAQVVGPALCLDDALALVPPVPGQPIAAAVLDVDLAGHEVYPVASRLRADGVPIVFHTGHGRGADLAEMFPGSITCTKPTLPDALVTTLMRLMR